MTAAPFDPTEEDFGTIEGTVTPRYITQPAILDEPYDYAAALDVTSPEFQAKVKRTEYRPDEILYRDFEFVNPASAVPYGRDKLGDRARQEYLALTTEAIGQEKFRTAEQAVTDTEIAKQSFLGYVGTELQQELVANDPRTLSYQPYRIDLQLAEAVIAGSSKTGKSAWTKEHPWAGEIPSQKQRQFEEFENKRAANYYDQEKDRLRKERNAMDRKYRFSQEYADGIKRARRNREKHPEEYEEYLRLTQQTSEALQLQRVHEFPGAGQVKYLPYTTQQIAEAKAASPQVARDAISEFLNAFEEVQDEMIAAAGRGDWEAADALREERDQMFGDPIFQGETGAKLREAFSPYDDPALQGMAAASTEAAKTIGRRMQESRALKDPTSEEYQRRYGEFVDAPLQSLEAGRIRAGRAISQSRREAERTAREMGMAAGVGRNPEAMSALLDRVGEMSATQQANVELAAAEQSAEILSLASQYLTGYADEFEIDAVQSAINYATMAPGLRDRYVDQITAVQFAGINYQRAVYGEQVARLSHLDTLNQQQNQFEANQKMALLDMYIGSSLSLVGAGLSAYGASGGG